MSIKNNSVPIKANVAGWKQRVQHRKKNKWLIYSSQIARRILAAIDDRPDLNQAKLANEIDVSAQYISRIVKGQENLTLETISKLADALGTELIVFPPYKYSSKLLGKDFHSTSFQIQGSFTLTTTINISDSDEQLSLSRQGFRKVLSVSRLAIIPEQVQMVS